MKILKDINPEITTESICRLLGYGKSKKLSRQILTKIKTSVDNYHHLIKPKVLYTEKAIKKIENGSVILKGNISFKSRRMSGALEKSNRVAVFLTTIGKSLDSKINELMKQKKLTEAYIFDAIGSVAAEETVEKFQKRFDAVAEKNKERTTLRFSPGYCDWKIQEQKKIFQIIDNTLIDVELNSSCLMKPRKSVSGIFGIGNIKDIGKNNTNPCKSCGLKNCIARRK